MNNFGADVQGLGVGILLARLIIGLAMAAHGTQKLFGWFGGYGLGPTGEFMVQLGFSQGRTFAAIASITEITSGLLVALGFLGPIGPALMISVMIVASITVHWKNGFFASKNGFEVPLLYMSAALVFAMVGFGPDSLDALFANHWSSGMIWIVLAIGAVGGLANAALGTLMKPAAKKA